jgi:predicted esterase
VRALGGLDVDRFDVGPATVEPRPLVVAFHGRGGTPAPPALPPGVSVRVLVPHGPHVLASGLAWSPLSVTSHRDDALAADLAVSARMLDAMLTEALADEACAGLPILAGYSQGAMVALALAARRTRRYELVLGACWAPPAIEAGLDAAFVARIGAAHGDADEIVPLGPTRALFDRLRARGLDADLAIVPGESHAAAPNVETRLAARLAEAIDRQRPIHVYSRPEVARVALDILIGPDVFVNASVAAGTPPEHIARRVLGKPGEKPKSTRWVMTWTKALLSKTPGFKADAIDAQMKTIEGLLEIVELQDKTPEGDWVKGLVASAKAAKLKRVVTDHPDLADKTEVDGIQFLSSEAWLVEQTTPPPPPPPGAKKSTAPSPGTPPGEKK